MAIRVIDAKGAVQTCGGHDPKLKVADVAPHRSPAQAAAYANGMADARRQFAPTSPPTVIDKSDHAKDIRVLSARVDALELLVKGLANTFKSAMLDLNAALRELGQQVDGHKPAPSPTLPKTVKATPASPSVAPSPSTASRDGKDAATLKRERQARYRAKLRAERRPHDHV